jgi:DNA repair/transcription protein MET18/MMS19
VEGRDKYRTVLDALTELCSLPSLFEALVVRVTTKLDLLSSEELIVDRECSVAYSWDLLHTLQRVIDSKLEAKHVDLPKYFSQVVPRLFGLVITAALPRTDKVEPMFHDRRLIAIVATITETLFWELTPE